MLISAARNGLLSAAALAAPASAVTLGPLQKSGITDGPGKAFYLSLANPYPTAERFLATAIGVDDEVAQPRVAVFPDDAMLGGGNRRQLLVIIRDLVPGETYTFRLCAMRMPKPQETIHARVCSKLTARRLAVRG